MRQRFVLSVSVFVVVERGREVLLLRRAGTGWKDGWYSLPAGGLDGGEPLAAAAARELREETGLEAAPGDLRLVHLLHCRSGDTGGEWLGAFFHAGRWSGEPRITEPQRHDAIGWHDRDALPDPTIEYTRQALAAIGEGRSSSTFGWSVDETPADHSR
jgi:8-oxo-dGTP diphosphatase